MRDWKILIGIVAVVWGFAGCSADEDSDSAEEPLVMADSEVNTEESTEATDEESDFENREAGEEDSEVVEPDTDQPEEAEPEPEEGEEEPVEEEEETDEAGSTEDESESVEEESETGEEEESEIVETEGEEGAEPGVDETDETETDETPDEGALEMGTADAMASMACMLLEGERTPVLATAIQAEAGQVLLVPDTGYDVTLPESGIGFATLQVPNWMAIMGENMYENYSVQVLDPQLDSEVLVPLQKNGACPDVGLVERRRLFHAWGSFTVQIEGAPGETVFVAFVKN